MKRLILASICFSTLLCLPGAVKAQGGLQTGQVDIIKQFNARLAEAERVRINPQLPPLDSARRQMNYNIVNRALNVQYLPPRILPQNLKNEPKDPIYNGFFKLGAGIPNALLVEGGYDLTNKENLDAGIEFRHFSMDNSKKVENQKMADNDFGVHGTFHSDQGYSVKGKLNYSRDFVHFYGYNDLDDDFPSELSYNEADVKQRFSVLSGQAKLFNNQRTAGDIDYSASLDFYALEDFYAARETGVNIILAGKKWINGAHPLGVQLQTDFTAYRDSAKQTLNNFFLTPTYAYHGERFRVMAGLNIASHNDEFKIFPLLEGSVNVVENFITAFVGTEGNLQKNNFLALTTYNPFLNSRQRLRNSYYNHFYGGVKGEYRGVNYRAQIGYKNVDNLALFLTNGDSIPRFNVLYDSAGIFTLSLELRTQLIEGLEINGRFSQHVFNLQNQEKPWHLPSISLNAGLAYTGVIEGLALRSEVFFQNAVPTLAADGTPKNLNTLLDISAGADYQFAKNIGAFVQANNLLNNRYQRWQHYPTIGLNIVAGLKARF